jgi:MFS family permease
VEDGRAALPRTIWALGLVSLFMDVSSEMIHGLLPVFLIGTLGASALTLGFIEGAAEGAASLLKLPSGWLSDRWRRRKPLAVAGYALSALVKPMFALAPTVGWVFAARFLDRLGKGVRGAPRDALVADLAPPRLRGAAFGLRQTLDTVGAFAGPLLAVALMELSGSQVRLVFWAAVVPALLSVALLVKLVPEPAAAMQRRSGVPQPAVRIAALAELGGPFWGVLAVAMVFMVGRYSEAFLVLSALGRDLPVALAPLVLVTMNAVYAIAAYPVGRLSDRVGRWGLLALGTVAMAAADLVLALTGSLAMAIVAVMLWGLHMALSQGILAALVADAAEVRLRGTAFGLFNALSGVALLAANAGAGFLWARTGPSSAFLAGAAIALLTLVLIVAGGSRERPLAAP